MEGLKMRKTIASLAVMATLGAPVAARAGSPGEEVLFASLAMVSNVFYTPVKVAVATGGLVVGAVAGTLGGGDTRAAYAFWVPTAGGDYFLTADQIDGSRPIEFLGYDYADRPGTYGRGSLGSTMYESMYDKAPDKTPATQ